MSVFFFYHGWFEVAHILWEPDLLTQIHVVGAAPATFTEHLASMV